MEVKFFIPYLDVNNSELPIYFDSEFEKQLEIAIHTDYYADVEALIEDYFVKVYSQAVSTTRVYEHLLYLGSLFTRIIQSRVWSMQEVLRESLLSKEQIVEWAKRVAGRIALYRENVRR